MKRLFTLLNVLTLSSIAAFAQPACQNLVVELNSSGSYSFAVGSSTPQLLIDNSTSNGNATVTQVWQSFIPTADGILHNFTVNFSASYTPATTATVNIYSGQGTGGTLLTSLTVLNITTLTGSTEFVLEETIDVTAGNDYTFEIVDDSGNPFQLQRGPSYANGIVGGTGTIVPSDDLLFTVDLLERPDVDNGSDNATFGIASFDVDISSFDCADAESNVTVTLTVNDNNGGTSSCTSTVTVEDNENPTATCIATTPQLVLDATGSVAVTPADVDDGSSDNCSVALTTNVASFDCGDVGPQSVTLTATDPSGNSNSCIASIEVIDDTPPNAVCQPFTLVLDGSGAATLTVSNINNGSSDNCGISTTTLSQTAFNCGNLGANTVTLTVTDINGNVSTCDATVTVEDNQVPTISCPSDIVVCAIDASGAVVTYPNVTGSDNCTSVTSQTDASGLTSGNVFPVGTTPQEWTVTDIAGNSASCSFTVTVDAKPVADYTATAACEGQTVFFTDESTIDPSGTIASWTWDMGDGSAPIGLVDPAHVYADTGSYDVELIVASVAGCEDTATATIYVGPVPSAGFTVANACEGIGTVFTNTSSIVDGTLSYTWDFGDGNISSDQDPTHTYAVSGTYTVTLTARSDNGCEDEFTQSVEVFDSPNALFTASEVCEGTSTVFTNLSTGGGIVSSSWDFGDLSPASSDENPSYTYASSGTYSVNLTVTNSDGCEDTHTANVTVNELPTVDFSFDDVCEGTAADFTNNSSSGSYTWDFGDNNSSTLNSPSNTYTQFGTYDVTLSVLDGNFCSNSGTAQIEVFDLPDFTTTASDVLCFGESTGSIVANPQGTPSFPWDFSINNGTPQINDTFLDLPAGTYDVSVSDANGCEFTVETEVGQPAAPLGISIIELTDVLCHGEALGSVEIEGIGGTSGYEYAIDAGPSQNDGLFENLLVGAHDVEITDANACVFDTTFSLTEPDTLILDIVSASDLLCNGDGSGSIEVQGTGGVPTFEYNLNGGIFGSGNAFENLDADDYIVGVRDANGCEDTVQVSLEEPGILQLSLLDLEDAACFGQSSGSIEVGAASGTPDYAYSIDGTNFQVSGVFEGLGAATYTILAIDANGCEDELTETVSEPSELQVETNSTPVACFGDASGDIEVIASGGTPGNLGYSYSIDGGENFSQNGGVFADLESDSYLIVVADTNGCTASEGVVISQPSAALDLNAQITDALCLDSASGSVVLVAVGGTPAYVYSEDNSTFVTSNEFGGFAAGTYTLYAQDVNGCSDSIQVVIDEPSTSVNITNVLLNNPACPNQASGTATVQVTGGTPGYTYSGNAGNTFQSSQIIIGLNGGNHLIIVQDANGCTDSDTITLTSPPIFDLVVDTIINIECGGDFDGELHVLAEGGTPSYNYSLNGGNIQSNGNFTNLTDGEYIVSIMDVNGCMYSETFEIEAAQALPVAEFDFTLSGTAVLFQNQSSFGDSYSWTFGDDSTSTEMSPVHVYQEDGEYTVTLTVTNSCGTDQFTMTVSTTAIGIEEANGVSFVLFPNPASENINLQVSGDINEDVRMDVISITGGLVSSRTLHNISMNEIISIDVNGLAEGIYYLRLVTDADQSVLRFDIIK